MKKSAIFRIVIYSLVILVLLALLGTTLALHAGVKGVWNLLQNEDLSFQEVLEDDMEEAFHEAQEDQNADYYMEAQQGNPVSVHPGDVQEMEIQWISGDVTVVSGDVEDIKIQETVSGKPMLYSVRNGKLLIKFSREMSKKFQFSIGDKFESKDLTVTVPKTWKGSELTIQGVSADVELQNLQLSEIEYQGVSGECVLNGCRVGELSIQTVSGDVKVNGEIRELECESVSADCQLTVTNVPEEISMEGVSGRLDLTLPADAGSTVDLDGLSKDLDTDFPVISKNGKFVAGDGSCEISIDGISGNARIRKAS